MKNIKDYYSELYYISMFPRNGNTVNVMDTNEKDTPLYRETELHEEYASLNNRKEVTALQVEFFSKKNIQNIQDNIRFTVYKKVNKVIGEQSQIDLHILMTAMYDEYGENTECGFDIAIKKLNEKVIDQSVKIVVTNLQQYLLYLVDKSSKLPVPPPRQKSLSIKGERVLENNFLI